jgi:hypothetical protein
MALMSLPEMRRPPLYRFRLRIEGGTSSSALRRVAARPDSGKQRPRGKFSQGG